MTGSRIDVRAKGLKVDPQSAVKHDDSGNYSDHRHSLYLLRQLYQAVRHAMDQMGGARSDQGVSQSRCIAARP